MDRIHQLALIAQLCPPLVHGDSMAHVVLALQQLSQLPTHSKDDAMTTFVGHSTAAEVAVIRTSADSTVALDTADTPVKLTDGAALGALAIDTPSTDVGNFTAAAGEYELRVGGQMLVDVALRGAKTVAGSVVTLKIVAGLSGGLAGSGTTLANVIIPAAAGIATFHVSDHFLTVDLPQGAVIWLELESDNALDDLAITHLVAMLRPQPRISGHYQ